MVLMKSPLIRSYRDHMMYYKIFKEDIQYPLAFPDNLKAYKQWHPEIPDISVPFAGKRGTQFLCEMTGKDTPTVLEKAHAKNPNLLPIDVVNAYKTAYKSHEPATSMPQLAASSSDAAEAVKLFAGNGVVIFPAAVPKTFIDRALVQAESVWGRFPKTYPADADGNQMNRQIAQSLGPSLYKSTKISNVRGQLQRDKKTGENVVKRGWFSMSLGWYDNRRTAAYHVLTTISKNLEPFIRSNLGNAR